MKTKIILGLGLCLLLTVINLQRAMDNYGITDAKFKVDVLAESSSSSASYDNEAIYESVLADCTYTFTEMESDGISDIATVTLFGCYFGETDLYGNCSVTVCGGATLCVEGGTMQCMERMCENVGGGDAWVDGYRWDEDSFSYIPYSGEYLIMYFKPITITTTPQNP